MYPDVASPAPDSVAAALPPVVAYATTHSTGLTQGAVSATAMAAEVAQLMDCERVSVGLLDRGRLKVAATSQGHELEAGRDTAARIAAAMHEALDQSTSISHPPAPQGPDNITLAQQILAGGAGAACSIPMTGVRGVVGALTLERQSRAFTAAEVALGEDLASFAGPVLAMASPTHGLPAPPQAAGQSQAPSLRWCWPPASCPCLTA